MYINILKENGTKSDMMSKHLDWSKKIHVMHTKKYPLSEEN